jgi:hypothetical protein
MEVSEIFELLVPLSTAFESGGFGHVANKMVVIFARISNCKVHLILECPRAGVKVL